MIENFINHTIPQKVEEAFAQFSTHPNLDTIKNEVFNDLYTFFNRFYENGDFIPQRRYKIRKITYAIPYNGEEVKLHYATSNMYYIKTGTLFRDYTFTTAPTSPFKVIFKISFATEEIASNKATKSRYFILSDTDDDPIIWDQKNETLIINFHYIHLTDTQLEKYSKAITEEENNNNIYYENSNENIDETDSFGNGKRKKTIKQELINRLIYEEIITKLKNNENTKHLTHFLEAPCESNDPVLLYHINRFTAKNNTDFFIHKDLKSFLVEQLDFFLKSEVFNLDTFKSEPDLHLARIQITRDIAQTIIDFLSQIENFLKKLWEKKKFVINTHYVITLDRIYELTSDEFFNRLINIILENRYQLYEWEILFGIKVKSKDDLFRNHIPLKLPIDTRYFPFDFKFELLEELTKDHDLDDLLDGLLIKSENWQALNLLLNKYKEKIQTIYIDPPFNKEYDADYLYNVKYKDSTWATMLENRLRLAKDLLKDTGSIFVRCDYNGNWILRPLMNEIFGKENFRNEIIVRKGKRTESIERNRFENDTESLMLFSANKEKAFVSIPLRAKPEEKLEWTTMFFPEERGDPNRLFWGISIKAPAGTHWQFSQERINQEISKGNIKLVCKQCGWEYQETTINRRISSCPKCGSKKFDALYLRREIPVNNDWTDILGYTYMISKSTGFPTENSEILLKRVIESTSNEGDLVMDFFLGSGTTTAVAHKLGRKWIGVEMGEHFWTIVLPRMKKVLFYDKSGISKEEDVKEKYNEKTAGGFFKYQIIEQYEDTLDNIEFTENEQARLLFKDDYLIKYYTHIETQNSPFLLNIEQLRFPFNYKLKFNPYEVGSPIETVIDIPETFNYLLGVKIKKLVFEKSNDNPYFLILAEKDNLTYLIVWRNVPESWSKNHFDEDRSFIEKFIKKWKPDSVYINSPSTLIPDEFNLNYIEPIFKKLMIGENHA
ncbi:site-specific DNA-methyltransferase [Candidatus Chrysopegis kryptomonas]|nr:site-specific DNA-methyltransferase [Candidatus Chrysopegis kryptomonas]